MSALGLVLAAVVGLSLGLLGGGGSILTVPIFVYVLGFDPKPAIAMSLAVVGLTSVFGAIGHWRAGNIDFRAATVFGPVAFVNSFLGARLAGYLSGSVQLIIFAVIMMLAAIFMLRGRVADQSAADREVGWRDLPLGWLAAAGITVGLITGVVGVGGGFLIVPALVLLARVPMKQAVGTSLLLIAVNSAAGFAGYLGQIQVQWDVILGFAGVASIAIVAGAYLVRFVSPDVLRRSFAVFLVVMGLFILYQNRDIFLPAPAPISAAENQEVR